MSKGRARRIYAGIDELYQCCEAIKESKKSCEICPMKHHCIDETSVLDFGLDVTFDMIDEFLECADEVSSYAPTQEEWEAEEANVRRCDPDEWD